MSALRRRLDALETRGGAAYVPWVLVQQEGSQSEAEAIAAHEVEHGPIPQGQNVFHVIFRDPIETVTTKAKQ